jgi:putative membrane protein
LRSISYIGSVDQNYPERRSSKMASIVITMAEMGPWDHGSWGHGGAFLGPWILVSALLWLAFFGLLVWVAVRMFYIRQGGGRMADSAEEILRQRFARGEVDVETYENALDALRRNYSGHRSYDDYVKEAEEGLRADEQDTRP